MKSKLLQGRRLRTVTSALFWLCALLTSTPAIAGDYFVSAQGDDDNNGQNREKAFLTIQKGLNALEPGDTLTIGPGEYFENVQRADLGSMEWDTVVRAEIPGTAVLRGDVPAPAFRKVDGYRFVYATQFDQVPTVVLEHHGMTMLLPKANVEDLEFSPGCFHYDAHAKTLYISNSDLGTPDQHRYTVSVNEGNGLELNSPKRVLLEGLAATGFYPGWGMLLTAPVSCKIRDCVTYMNIGGITLQPHGGIQGDDCGTNNTIEDCVSYANRFGGIVRYGANKDIIQDCYTYRNALGGGEHHGIMHYLRMPGSLLIKNNLSWGQRYDYSVKPPGKEKLENCIALGSIRNANTNVRHNLIGGGNEYDPGSTAPADSILFPREPKLDKDFEFADPHNLDFRLQPDSRFRGTAPDGTDRGPHPYEANVFYLSPMGSDRADGLSMRQPWKTLGHAFKRLRPGDTLYLAEGEYAAALLNKAGDGEAPIRICGRGRGTIVIAGRLTVSGCAGITCDRLNFSAAPTLRNSHSLAFRNCVFFGHANGLNVDSVKGLRLTHTVLAGAPIQIKKSVGIYLSGNIFANAGKPAVRLDSAAAIRYSDYNGYQDKARCWEVNGETWSFADVQQGHDRYSKTLTPEFLNQDGVPRLQSDRAFKSAGPGSTALGIHHEYVVSTKPLQLVGPFLHSTSDTTANIEWWTTAPATFSLSWGETPEMKNLIGKFKGADRFNTFSLTGLKPGKRYYFKIHSANATRNRVFVPVLEPKNATLSFKTARKAVESRTYYVAPDGDDGKSGLARDRAFRTVSHAANLAGPGDTVLIASGEYNETVRIRAAGTKERPITFRSIPGEKAVFRGENLSRFFDVAVKPDLRFDGLYFQGRSFYGEGSVVRQSERVQFTRCFRLMVSASDSPEMLVRNCLLFGGWTALALGRCPDSLVENNVFIMTTLQHFACNMSVTVRRNIFSENIPGKVNVTLLKLSADATESDNCFYMRWSEDERPAINYLTLPEWRARTGSNALATNPMMPGTRGWRVAWLQSSSEDFDDFFATNPRVVLRGIGLQPDAFGDFKLEVGEWAYDRAWAEAVARATRTASALELAGKDAEALATYERLMEEFPLSKRLKSEILERASVCAARLKNYPRAMQLARDIPVKPISMRRQMQLMLEEEHHAALLCAFSPEGMRGRSFLRSFVYPELEDVMADLYYYRSLAYLDANDLEAAEADLRFMNEKRARLGYRSGEGIHDRVWLHLGDFYRMQLEDDGRALDAYAKVCSRTTWAIYGRPLKPVSTGGSETLVAATKAASEILLEQGKVEEVRKLQFNLLKAQAEAWASLLERSNTLSKFRELLALPGTPSEDVEECAKRIERGEGAVREELVAALGGMAAGLTADARDILAEAAVAPDPELRQTALRALLVFVPVGKADELLVKTEEQIPAR